MTDWKGEKMDTLLIRNGMVVNAENGTMTRADILAEGGWIRKAEPGICDRAVSEIDASGCYVTPGLVDHHTHIYPMASIGISGEAACFGSGVTTAVDAGSMGCGTYERYRPWIQASKLAIRPYIHVSTGGLSTLPDAMEDVNPRHMDAEGIRELFRRYGDELAGLKIWISRNIVGDLGMDPLKRAVEIAELTGVPLMVHITDPPASMEEVLSVLRPGDIVTHMYQNTGPSILDHGAVSDSAKAAREKGVLFEAADARAHFSFEVSEPAIAEGFYPDLLGTDITRLSMHLRPTAFNMAMQLSKYNCLGIPFGKLIHIAAWKNAVNLGLSDQIGSLRPGKRADIAVFRPCRRRNIFGDRPFSDENAGCREGDLVYEPVLTVKAGEMVWRSVTF